MNKNTKLQPFTRKEFVVALILKAGRDGKPMLLCGKKHNRRIRRRDPCAGFVVQVGGKIESSDLGIINAAFRESKHESGLTLLEGRTVAVLNARFEKSREWNRVHVVMSTSYEGRVRRCEEEFKWLKFIPVEKLPWEDMPPGDKDWLNVVLSKRKRCTVTIACGENRKDLLRKPRIRPMH